MQLCLADKARLNLQSLMAVAKNTIINYYIPTHLFQNIPSTQTEKANFLRKKRSARGF